MRKPRIKSRSDADVIFAKLKDIGMRYADHRSSEFMQIVREESGRPQFHHLCGSYGPRKSTDFLGVGVTAEEHAKAEDSREYNLGKIPKAVENLIRYVIKLENELKYYRKGGKNAK